MNREKVKKELLELNAKAYGLWVHDQKNEFLAQIGNVTDDVLELLKEQEAVEPYQHDAVWLCGNCGKEVVGWDDDIDGKEYRYPFCRQCGRPVKWDA